MSPRKINSTDLRQYHPASWYAVYRFVIAICLLFSFLITYQNLELDYSYPSLYLMTILSYAVLSFIQLILYRSVYFHKQKQVSIFFVLDVLFFSALTFALNGPSLQISLLFVIAIFAATLLLDATKSLIITLIAVITIIYQQFIVGLFSFSSLQNIGESALLAVLFLMVYLFGQFILKRFQVLEHSNIAQSLEIYRLQNITRYILEQIDTGYLVINENYHIILSNPAARELLDMSPLYAIDPFPLYKAQPDLFDTIRLEDNKIEQKFEFESLLSHRKLHIHVQKLIVPRQTLTLLTLQDAKRVNQHAQQLKLAALGQLTASIAHEIRNPLSAIIQANSLLQGSDEQQQQLLQGMIAKQANRINKIVEDTLSMVRNKQTMPTLIRLDVFIPKFTEEHLNDITDQIELELEENCYIYFDESQLQQVLINLLRNAVRHNQKNTNKVQVRIYRNSQNINIDVLDYGEGVAKHHISSLFQPFFSTEISGVGLGLYLSHSFCEANQAKLSYVEQDIGACFRIECACIETH